MDASHHRTSLPAFGSFPSPGLSRCFSLFGLQKVCANKCLWVRPVLSPPHGVVAQPEITEVSVQGMPLITASLLRSSPSDSDRRFNLIAVR